MSSGSSYAGSQQGYMRRGPWSMPSEESSQARTQSSLWHEGAMVHKPLTTVAIPTSGYEGPPPSDSPTGFASYFSPATPPREVTRGAGVPAHLQGHAHVQAHGGGELLHVGQGQVAAGSDQDEEDYFYLALPAPWNRLPIYPSWEMQESIDKGRIMPFDGTRSTYESWRNQFIRCIHRTESNVLKKALALQASLDEDVPALGRIVEAMSPTAQGYREAIQKLEEEYGSAHRHCQEKLEQLLQVTVKSGDIDVMSVFVKRLKCYMSALDEANKFELLCEASEVHNDVEACLDHSLSLGYVDWLEANDCEPCLESLCLFLKTEMSFYRRRNAKTEVQKSRKSLPGLFQGSQGLKSPLEPSRALFPDESSLSNNGCVELTCAVQGGKPRDDFASESSELYCGMYLQERDSKTRSDCSSGAVSLCSALGPVPAVEASGSSKDVRKEVKLSSEEAGSPPDWDEVSDSVFECCVAPSCPLVKEPVDSDCCSQKSELLGGAAGDVFSDVTIVLEPLETYEDVSNVDDVGSPAVGLGSTMDDSLASPPEEGCLFIGPDAVRPEEIQPSETCADATALPSDRDDQGTGAYDWRINDMFKKIEPTDQCETMPAPNDEELDVSPIHAEWKEEQQGLVHGNQLWDPGGQPQAAGGNLDEKYV